MNNGNMERKIKKSFEKATPNLFDTISKDCNTGKGEVITMTKSNKNTIIKRLVAVAAVLAIVLSGFGVAALYKSSRVEVARVDIDVNPGVEIKLNKNDKVLNVVPLNDDGKKIIGNMDLKNTDLDTAVNAIIGSMVKNGYLSEIANSVLVSVEGEDPEKTAKMQKDISSKINQFLTNSNLESAVISQNIDPNNKEAKELAEKCGISEGKAQYILEFTAQNPEYKAEDLAGCKVNELNILAQKQCLKAENVDSSGQASDKAYIGKGKAENIAFSSVGVSRKNVKNLDTEIDMEKVNGKMTMIYEVEFEYNKYEYDVDVDAVTGSVLDKKSKPVVPDKNESDDDDNDTTTPNVTEKPLDEQETTNKPDTPDKDEVAPDSKYITKDAVKKAVLKHIGKTDADVKYFECNLERESKRVIYDVDININGTEYEASVCACTGRVLKCHKDLD